MYRLLLLTALTLTACGPNDSINPWPPVSGAAASSATAELRDSDDDDERGQSRAERRDDDEEDRRRGPNLNPGIARPGSSPRGLTYARWQTRWWKWLLAQPSTVNPAADATGADCAQGQSGDVWFLAGNFGGATTRNCTIPSGKALFFPVVNVVWVQFKTDPPATVKDLRQQLRPALLPSTLSVTIDGRPVVKPEQYLDESTVFTARLPDDNIFGVDDTLCDRDRAGRLACSPSLDLGYYLFVRPLSKGAHTIRFTAATPVGFSLDVTYNLQVL